MLPRLLAVHLCRWGVLATACIAATARADGLDASPDFEWHTQATYVFQEKPGFSAQYSGVNSLSEMHERSYTISLTGYLGARLWQGAEAYLDAESIQGIAISNLQGLGGPPNGELQKVTGANPTLYVPRAYLRQTWDLSDTTAEVESDLHQLSGSVSDERIVATVGKLAVNDIFDTNRYNHDPRTQFLNWAALDAGSFDFAADARGFSWGAAIEYDAPGWALRAGRFMVPRDSNGEQLNYSIMDFHGDEAEIEHDYDVAGQPGALRLTTFRNHAVMGSFDDALALAQLTGTIPTLADVRRPATKIGDILGLEQELPGNVGVFARIGWSDGQTETYSYTEVDRTVQAGAVAQGASWQRADDSVGAIAIINNLSTAHQHYLGAGGLGFFLGDGRLDYRPEEILETYYSIGVARHVWVSIDVQHIADPAYNAARGPVWVYGTRLHAEL